MKAAFIAFSALLLCGCATPPPIRWASPSDVDLVVSDQPALQRFDLVLTSRASSALCMEREAWPGEDALTAGFDGATVTVASGTKPLTPTGSAYCPGGCGEVRLEPGGVIRGTLRYAAFEDAAEIAADASRTLNFDVHPYECSK